MTIMPATAVTAAIRTEERTDMTWSSRHHEPAPAPQAPVTWGVMAEFPDVTSVFRAAERVRDAGFRKWDVYAPFPIHNINRAMGLKPSRVSYCVGTGAFLGIVTALAMQFWMGGIDYKILVGGKPLIAWEQATPITFELAILFASFSALFGMLAINKLPMWYHPLLKKERFLRVSDDRFVIAIEAADSQFDQHRTAQFLSELGGTHIEVVEA